VFLQDDLAFKYVTLNLNLEHILGHVLFFLHVVPAIFNELGLYCFYCVQFFHFTILLILFMVAFITVLITWNCSIIQSDRIINVFELAFFTSVILLFHVLLIQIGTLINREYVVDLVGQPGNVHGPDSTINEAFLSSMPSPFQIPHLNESQQPYIVTWMMQLMRF
jgi:hypothetical protein